MVLYVREVPASAAAGPTCSWPTPRPASRPRSTWRATAAWSSIASGAPSRWCSRTARATRPMNAGNYEVFQLRATAAQAGSGSRVSARRAGAGRPRDVDAELRARAAELEAAGHLSAQRAVRDPQEVLDSVRLPRVRTDRPGARRHQPPRRQAGELRHRHRRHLRLLRAALARPVARARPHHPAVACGVAAQHRPRGASACCCFCGATAPPTGRCGLAALARNGSRLSGSRRSGCRCSGRSTGTSPRPTRASRRWPPLALAGIFYISTFLDLSDKVFRGGEATWAMLGAYLLVHHAAVRLLHPAAVRAARRAGDGRHPDQEQRAGRDEGVRHQPVPRGGADARRRDRRRRRRCSCSSRPSSDRRTAAPKPSDTCMRGGSPQTFDVLLRRWVVGSGGDIYHYDYYDPRAQQLSRPVDLRVQRRHAARSPGGRSRSARSTSAARATDPTSGRLERGWTRELTRTGDTHDVHAVRSRPRSASSPSAYFATQQPDERFMSYSQLRDYTERLRASGFDVSAQHVALERKLSFPFVTLVMTLIAVPFAVTTGRRGAMYGIGVGHRARDRLLGGDQRLRRARDRRAGDAGAGRMGAQSALRRRRRLSAADRPYLISSIQIVPLPPSGVLTVSMTKSTAWAVARLGCGREVAPPRRHIVEVDRDLSWFRVEVHRPVPPLPL